jgi:hypothetical protein
VGGDEDDRNRDPGLHEALLQVEATEPGHVDVQHQAIDGLGVLQAEELGGRAERLHREPGTSEQPREGAQDGFVVVDDSNDRPRGIARSRSRFRIAEERRPHPHQPVH